VGSGSSGAERPAEAPEARSIGMVSDGVSAGPPTISGHYPAGLEADERLRDGIHVLVRPIRSSDGSAMTAFHESLSPRSVYRRFFFAHPHLSPGEVERFTTVDYVDRMAFVVVVGDRIVGVGRYERLGGSDEAEVAFVVTDAYQRRGIGALLLDHLAEAARPHGISRFMAQTLSENRDMLGVFLASGFPVATSSEGGTVSVHFPIARCEEYARARKRRTSRVGGGPSAPDADGGVSPDSLGR
jgi:GNAT superfamily N-acetyltransferase